MFSGNYLSVELLEPAWEIVRHGHGVAVLVSRGREVLGVRQFRPAIGRATWEVPAGLIEPGETPAEAAARELAEEARLQGELRELTSLYASPGFTDERVHLFELVEPRPAYLPRGAGEELELEWRDAAEMWRAIAAGSEATSGVSLVALRHLLARLGLEP